MNQGLMYVIQNFNFGEVGRRKEHELQGEHGRTNFELFNENSIHQV